MIGRAGIQIEIKLEDIHPGFAEQTDPALTVVGVDQALHRILVKTTRLGDARNLERGCGRRDLRIEPAAGGRDEIHRYSMIAQRRFSLAQGLDAGTNRIDEGLIGGTGV
jgi:hypothetical protein